jgi:hypothetical protein
MTELPSMPPPTRDEKQQQRLWVVVPGHGDASRLQSFCLRMESTATKHHASTSPLCHVEYHLECRIVDASFEKSTRFYTVEAINTIAKSLNPPSYVAVLMDDVNALDGGTGQSHL